MDIKKFIKTVLITVFLGFSNNLWSEYKLEKNESLELCQEFHSYLSRHPKENLSCGLKEDNQFKGFQLPSSDTGKKSEGVKILFQDFAYSNYYGDLNKWEKYIKRARKRISGIDVHKYQLDINHDGVKDRVLTIKSSILCEENGLSNTQSYMIDEYGNLHPETIDEHGVDSLSGHIFFYNGRVYSAYVMSKEIGVYEPSNWGGGLFQGRAICVYRN